MALSKGEMKGKMSSAGKEKRGCLTDWAQKKKKEKKA